MSLGRDVISRTDAEVIGSSPVERTAAGEALGPEQELMTINVGPHHPATRDDFSAGRPHSFKIIFSSEKTPSMPCG